MCRLGGRRCCSAVAVLAALAIVPACAAPVATPAAPTPASPTAESQPITRYELTPLLQRKPITIDWHDESHSFFVGTFDGGTIYRGRLDDPAAVVYLEGRRGQMAHGIDVVGDRMFIAGGLSGDIRVHDLASREQLGSFNTGSGGFLADLVVTGSGDVWATDLVRPVLWHLTPELIAAGGGIPLALPLAPELTFISSPDNSYGIVGLSDQRLVVVQHIDGALYLIELDPQVPNGRTITRIGGVTVPLGEDMILDGNRLVVADNDGLSVVELSPDGRQGRLVQQLRDPSFRETASVARAGDRYLVVNAGWDERIPDTISSVPAA